METMRHITLGRKSMETRPIDPRTATGEIDAPNYRVYFWSNNRTSCDEWQLRNPADINEVLGWSTEQSAGREVEVFAEITLGETIVLVKLVSLPN